MDNKQKTYTLIKEVGTKGVSSSQIAEELNVTRAYAQRIARQLITEGLVIAIGNGPSSRYVSATENISPEKLYSRLVKRGGLDEDIVYKEIVEKAKLLIDETRNVQSIFRYAFTEMLNNAIEHSESQKIKMEIKSEKEIIRFTIRDWGIGLFNNIQKKMKLSGIEDAIAEVTKGKITTMPARHSGEGIFFTSRVVDSLAIRSSGKEIIFNNRVNDVFLKNTKIDKGTLIICTIDKNASRDITSVFRSYTNQAYEFNKTEILVKLFAIGGEKEYISRSQARRILEGLNKFSKIILDFNGVDSVGQGFVHEIFIVWANDHKDVAIGHRNANENIEFMIRRAK